MTGCTSDISNIPTDVSAAIYQTNDSSTLPGTSEPVTAQQSSSPKEDNSDAINYDQYLKKVWVVKTWTSEEAYYYSSFSISNISNGKIEGKFSAAGIAMPDSLAYTANLTGTIKNGIAECVFSNKRGDTGNVQLTFISSDEIEATIKYTFISEALKDFAPYEALDGIFEFKPYNISDIRGTDNKGFNYFKDFCFALDLNSWGSVNFVSGKVVIEDRIPTRAFLTNDTGDIFYEYSFPTNVDFFAVSYQDVSKDGLKDLITIYGIVDDITTKTAFLFIQNEDGAFKINSPLSQEINESGNNSDIATIIKYLSQN